MGCKAGGPGRIVNLLPEVVCVVSAIIGGVLVVTCRYLVCVWGVKQKVASVFSELLMCTYAHVIILLINCQCV